MVFFDQNRTKDLNENDLLFFEVSIGSESVPI